MVAILPRRERRAFTDSSAYLAVLDRRDEHHAAALAILGQLARERFRSFSTTAVIIEAHALILSTMGRAVATRFLQDMERGSTTIIRVRAADEARARAIIYRYTDKDFSFTDAISFAVMERLGITRAFTFDHDFAQYGFTVLAPPPPGAPR
jgi:uncharacterized protein